MYGHWELILAAGVAVISCSVASTRSGRNNGLNRGSVTGRILHSLNVLVFQQCQKLCKYTSNCESLNWNPEKRLCQLMTNTDSSQITLKTTWTHAIIDRTDDRKICSVSACPFGRLCLPVSSSDFLCVTSFPGNMCQLPLGLVWNECLLSLHHGSYGHLLPIEEPRYGDLHRQKMGSTFLEPSTQSTVTAEHPWTQFSTTEELESTIRTSPVSSSDVVLTTWTPDSSSDSSSDTSSEVILPGVVDDMILLPSTPLEEDTPSVASHKRNSIQTETSLLLVTEKCVQQNCNTETPLLSMEEELSCISRAATVESFKEDSGLGLTMLNKDILTPNSYEMSSSIVNGVTNKPEVTFSFLNASTTTSVTRPLLPETNYKYTAEERKRIEERLRKRYGKRKKFQCKKFQLPFKEVNDSCGKDMLRRDGGDCHCKTGLHYDPRTNSCVKRCNLYGGTMEFQSRLYCISGRNRKTFRGKSVEKCIEVCVTVKSFVCRSFDYWHGTCHLSRTTASEIPKYIWSPWCGCVYYQRQCAD